MPGLDRTGPEGKGPRTGWGTGKCRPTEKDADPDEPRGRGGRGRKFRGGPGMNRGRLHRGG